MKIARESIIEPILLLAMLLAFWHHSPPIRDQWVWLLLLAAPLLLARFYFMGRLWTRTPLDLWFGLFLILSLLNFQFAPYHREQYFVLICRPMLGFLLVFFGAEFARTHRSIEPLLVFAVFLGLIVGFLGLTAVQWNAKSDLFDPITSALPVFPHRDVLPDMKLSFNPNEIAGAMSWLCPLMAGLTIVRWRWRMGRFLAGLAFLLLFAAMLLGQSRFGLMGLFIAFACIIGITIRQPMKSILFGILGLIVIFEVMLVLNLFSNNRAPINTTGTGTAAGVSQRDQVTFSTRFEIWNSALKMTADYPLTGVGMSMFGTAVRRPPYIVPHYANRNDTPPHAHNIWVEMAADMGLPGLVVLLGWTFSAGRMLLISWRRGNEEIRILSIAVGAGLMAFALYGLGDAIRIWDRFYFIYWIMLGLTAALYSKTIYSQTR